MPFDASGINGPPPSSLGPIGNIPGTPAPTTALVPPGSTATPANPSNVPPLGTPGTTALVDGPVINTNALQGPIFTVTIAGNRTLANPTNLVAGTTYQWVITQDAVGSRNLTYGNLFKWSSGVAPTLTPTPNAVDCISATYDGTRLVAVIATDFR